MIYKAPKSEWTESGQGTNLHLVLLRRKRQTCGGIAISVSVCQLILKERHMYCSAILLLLLN